ncbi:hypothetical protein MHU86_11950 [Fragilaria crotonensis]|nr:hypothetical protein MHU86_11950 [Fragilaria crotonensis]
MIEKHTTTTEGDCGNDRHETDGESDTNVNLVGFHPMSIGAAAADNVKDDPFLHPCLRRVRHVCGVIMHYPNVICATCFCCWSQADGEYEDPFYHDLTPESTLVEHCHKVTRWSRTLCVGLIFIALIAALLSSSWGLILLLILEVAVILYTIYWRYHRLDLSLNHTIHYFAMGTALSVAWSTIQSGLMGFLHWTPLLSTTSSSTLQFASTDPNQVWTCIQAFVVIGAWEEYLKYQGFAIIAQQQRGASSASSTRPPNWEDCQALLPTTTHTSGAPPLTSSGAAVTCAAIAVGTGFGWVNNFVYIQNDDKLSVRSSTILVGKLAILPMHTLLAAVQSIGLCSRDLEGNSRTLVLLPAIVFHGLFAYFILKLTEHEEEVALVAARELAAVWMTVLLTFGYYVYFAGRQRNRLQALDEMTDVVDTEDGLTDAPADAGAQSSLADEGQNLDR